MMVIRTPVWQTVVAAEITQVGNRESQVGEGSPQIVLQT